MRTRKKHWGTAKCRDVDRKGVCEETKKVSERRKKTVPRHRSPGWTLQ